jgi:hypothetical protein
MIAGVGFHPGLVFGGALAQDLRGRVTQTQAAQPVPSPSDAAAPLHLIEQLPVRRVALHDVVLRIDGVRLGGRRHSDPGPDANGLYLGAPPLRNQKFADSPVEEGVWSEPVSEIGFSVRGNYGNSEAFMDDNRGGK